MRKGRKRTFQIKEEARGYLERERMVYGEAVTGRGAGQASDRLTDDRRGGEPRESREGALPWSETLSHRQRTRDWSQSYSWGGTAWLGGRLALLCKAKEKPVTQVSRFGVSGSRGSKGRRMGLRLKEIKELGFLGPRLSSQGAGRDAQEAAVRNQSPAQRSETDTQQGRPGAFRWAVLQTDHLFWHLNNKSL